MAKIAVVEVAVCSDCPHCDNDYGECGMLNKSASSHGILPDCPLEDSSEKWDEYLAED